MQPRQALYCGLSLAFRPPTHGHVEGGAHNALLEMMAEAVQGLGCAALHEPLTRLQSALDAFAARDASEVLVELEAAYNRLFVGPLPPLVPPYESVYRTAAGLVMGDCTLAVLQAYAEEGLVLSAEHKDLPDHIAVELEYMACLCQREEEANATCAKAVVDTLRHREHAFLDGHLRHWLPQFCQRLLLVAASHYYGQWAHLARLFTQWDRQRMQQDKEPWR